MNKYTITHWESKGSYGTHEMSTPGDRDYLSPEHINKLFEYREMLGVMAVKKENKIITWELNNSWYSSDEIDRMLKLKAFS